MGRSLDASGYCSLLRLQARLQTLHHLTPTIHLNAFKTILELSSSQMMIDLDRLEFEKRIFTLQSRLVVALRGFERRSGQGQNSVLVCKRCFEIYCFIWMTCQRIKTRQSGFLLICLGINCPQRCR